MCALRSLHVFLSYCEKKYLQDTVSAVIEGASLDSVARAAERIQPIIDEVGYKKNIPVFVLLSLVLVWKHVVKVAIPTHLLIDGLSRILFYFNGSYTKLEIEGDRVKRTECAPKFNCNSDL